MSIITVGIDLAKNISIGSGIIWHAKCKASVSFPKNDRSAEFSTCSRHCRTRLFDQSARLMGYAWLNVNCFSMQFQA